MSYPPDTSRSSHEADGRSDRSGGSGGAASGSGGGVYGTLCSAFGGKWSTPPNPNEYNLDQGLPFSSSTSHERLLCNWKKWSLGLDYLLQDSEGVSLFKSYLQYEGCANLLDFWFACQGFRSKVDPSDHRKITQLIKVIYRTYIRGASCSNLGMASSPLIFLGKSQSGSVIPQRNEPIRLRSETRHAITERISRKHALDQTVFDSAQAEVEQFLRTTAYPAFLKSDIYVDFLQTALDSSQRKSSLADYPIPSSTSSASFTTERPITSLTECQTNLHLAGKILPTLDEDRELKSEELCPTDPAAKQTCKPHFCDSNVISDSLLMPHGHGHCQHCAQCYMQNFYHPCTPNERAFSPYPYQGLRPPWSCQPLSPTGAVSTGSGVSGSNVGAAPLTVENIQMTRFYRAELSLQHPYPNPSHSPQVTRASQQFESMRPVHSSRAVGPPVRHFQGHPNYVYTHWPDTLCPASMDPRSATRLPSQPPNPYHISYAPVSARDSEHHSLSSEARTDDTHSQTDSSHDGAMNRLRQHSLHNRYSSPFQSSRSQKQPTPGQASQQQQQQSQQQPSSTLVQPLHRRGAQFPSQLATEQGDGTCVPFRPNPVTYPIPFSPPNPASSGSNTDKLGHSEHDQSRLTQKHQRRAMRRNIALRSAEKNKLIGQSGSGDGATNSTGHVKSSKSTTRSYNLAEHDPAGFARVLSDKLQRLLDNQLATERLDHLMTDISPNVPDSKEPSEKQDIITVTTTTTTTNMTTTTTTTSSDKAKDSSKFDGNPNLTGNVSAPSSVQRTVGVGSSTTSAPSVLQRPWADKLLAAARVQHENTKDNAQAILEDHCSRIWAASADRTPTSSGSGSGGHPGQDGSLHPNLGEFGSSCTGVSVTTNEPQSLDYTVNFGEHASNRLGIVSDTVLFDSTNLSLQPSRKSLSPQPPGGCSSPNQPKTQPQQHHHAHHHHHHHHHHVRMRKRTQPGMLLLQSFEETQAVQEPVGQSASNLPTCHSEDQWISSEATAGATNSSTATTTMTTTTTTAAGTTTTTTTTATSVRSLSHGKSISSNEPVVSEPSQSWPCGFEAISKISFGPIESETQPSQNSFEPLSEPHSPMANETGSAMGDLPTSFSTGTSTAEAPISANSQLSHCQVSFSRSTPSQSTQSSSISAMSATSNSTPGGSVVSPTSLVIGYYLGDDPVPYRSLWPSSEITLGQFKQLIPKKKGLFRYFFKKASDEFGSGVVHQEITNDDTILPLWEGKVVAKVERVD